jgi:hypothetical protein
MAFRLPSPFGVAWEELALDDLVGFLNTAEDESLTWEAKGGNIRPEHLREEASAFGNSTLGGLLVLGATQDRDTGAWSIDGWTPPQREVDLWVHDCMDNGGVTPKPSVSVKAWELETGGYLACVAIWPVATPPVITAAGQVWERTSGKSVKVTDPQGLRRLFDRGEAARARAYQVSIAAADELLEEELANGHAGIAIGMAAPALLGDVATDIFRQSFSRQLNEDVQALQMEFTAAGLRQLIGAVSDWNQGGITFRSTSGFDADDHYTVRARRDGGVALAYGDPGVAQIDHPQIYVDRFVRLMMKGGDILGRLGAVGETHAVAKLQTRVGSISVSAWSSIGSDFREEVEAMMRDAQRALGLAGWEPENADGQHQEPVDASVERQ